jgi:hypothetical protein
VADRHRLERESMNTNAISAMLAGKVVKPVFVP